MIKSRRKKNEMFVFFFSSILECHNPMLNLLKNPHPPAILHLLFRHSSTSSSSSSSSSGDPQSMGILLWWSSSDSSPGAFFFLRPSSFFPTKAIGIPAGSLPALHHSFVSTASNASLSLSLSLSLKRSPPLQPLWPLRPLLPLRPPPPSPPSPPSPPLLRPPSPPPRQLVSHLLLSSFYVSLFLHVHFPSDSFHQSILIRVRIEINQQVDWKVISVKPDLSRWIIIMIIFWFSFVQCG